MLWGWENDNKGIKLFRKTCQWQYGEYIVEKAQWLEMKAKTVHKDL